MIMGISEEEEETIEKKLKEGIITGISLPIISFSHLYVLPQYQMTWQAEHFLRLLELKHPLHRDSLDESFIVAVATLT